MQTSKIIFNIPTNLKKAAASRAEREGITLTAILAQTIRAYGEGRVSMEVVESPRPQAARRMKSAIRDHAKGKNVSPSFDTADDAIAWLRSA